MSSLLPTSEWLAHLDREYLDGYVRDGGAAVKFAVPCDGTTAADLLSAVDAEAQNRGYVLVRLDAARTRIHLADRLFFAIAEQVPWDQLADAVLRRLAAAEGLYVPGQVTAHGLAGQIATASRVDEDYVRMAITKGIVESVFKNRDLAKDFRIAMTWLCRARLNGGDEGATTTRAIKAWLTGQVIAISEMKSYQIYTKVNRTNARYLLESLFAWVRKGARPGTVLLVDITQLTRKGPATDGLVNYAKAALLDAYEVLRQFVDSTDDLTGALLLVAGDEGLLSTEAGSRGLAAYQALKNRVFDEVRDRSHPNPMSSLVRLSAR
jgi:bacteriophage exclusion system BrxC/D-like protein